MVEDSREPSTSSATSNVGAILATVVMVLLPVALLPCWLAVGMASGNCTRGDTHLVCRPWATNVLPGILLIASALSAIVGAIAAWAGPRHRRIGWLAFGYAVTLISICVGFAISSTGP